MTESFLDRLEDQLVAAEHALAAAARPGLVRSTSHRRLLLALAALVVAVPAVAATQPWQPILGRPGLHDTPRGTSNTPVPGDVLAALAVLRRPQNAHDRSATAKKLLRGVGQEFAGVRLSSVRLVTLSPGHHALVLSAKSVGPPPSTGHRGTAEPVCLVFSGGGLCGGADALRTSGISMTAGPSLRGIVPDGVVRVTADFGHGRKLSTDVHDNVYWLKGAPTTMRAFPAPTRPGGRRLPPIPMTSPFTLHWLDAHGQTIGPAKPK
jgi:hypothetical protein